jgi:hypothetical protein
MGVDVGDAPVEPLMQVRAKAKLAPPAKMKIRDLDNFHSATFFFDFP